MISEINTDDWEKKEKGIKFVPVPKHVNEFMVHMRHVYNYDREDDWDDQKVYDERLVNMSVADINSACGWLFEHKDYLFTKKHIYYGRSTTHHMVATVPKVKYKSNWGGRGILATYMGNAQVLPLHKWNERVVKHWMNREEVAQRADRIGQENILKQFESSWLSHYEKRVTDADTKEFILDKTIKTMETFQKGESTSSHGAYSFSLDYHTRFIDRDTAELKPLGNPRSVAEDKLQHVTLDDLQQQKSELVERFVAMREKQHKMSTNWQFVMKKVVDVLHELRNKERYGEE